MKAISTVSELRNYRESRCIRLTTKSGIQYINVTSLILEQKHKWVIGFMKTTLNTTFRYSKGR